ncbi:N-acetylmuramoyl-L-alanine amidase [Aerococcaceae bacterium 50-4]
MKKTTFNQYKGILIAFGHGNGDPGAVSGTFTEAEMVRKLKPYLAKWAKEAGVKMAFYMDNLYQHAGDMKSYADWVVVEVHMDAAAKPQKGGHVIIHRDYLPDAMDQNLIDVIGKHFGLVTRNSLGLSKRGDLLNCNNARRWGINYRLLELFFLADATDRNYYLANLDLLAKHMVEAIIGVQVADDKVCQCTC